MSRKRPLTIEDFKSIYSRVTRATVDLVIRNEHGTLLSLRHTDGWEGMWHLPGGTILYREKISDAIQRIAEEEVGMKVSVEKFLDHIEFLSEESERGYGYSISMVFLCKPSEPVPAKSDKYTFFKHLPENIIVEQKNVISKL